MSHISPVYDAASASEVIRLRRFALSFGLVLLAYMFAGIEFDSPAQVSPLGIPFLVKRPQLLDIGLVLGSMYGALRYFYVGFIVHFSPHRVRWLLRDSIDPGLIDPALAEPEPHDEDERHQYRSRYQILVLALMKRYFRHIRHEIEWPSEKHQKLQADTPLIRVGTLHVLGGDEWDDKSDLLSNVRQTLDRARWRIFPVLEDLDYAFPVYFNVLVVVVFILTKMSWVNTLPNP